MDSPKYDIIRKSENEGSENMKVTWQQPPARGLGPTVLVETEGTVSRFVLKPHKDNIYLLEDVRLDKDLASAAREAVWEGFCDWMKKEQLLLLLGCRAAQSWFGAHPEHAELIAQKVKTKPGF